MAGKADPTDKAVPTTPPTPSAKAKVVRPRAMTKQQRLAKRPADFRMDRGDRQNLPATDSSIRRRLQTTPSEELVADLVSGKLAGESAEVARGILWQREAETMAQDKEKTVVPKKKIELGDWTSLALIIAIGLLLGIILATSAIDYLLG